MKIIKGNLILTEDTTFNESIEVEGNILVKDGKRFDLKVIGDINAWDINARNINAGDINAGDIIAGNIIARNIIAGNIIARNINAWDINAWDINAWDISYYAVCFAYNNIKCKSIKGSRLNCKHFVLDGKIEIGDKLTG